MAKRMRLVPENVYNTLYPQVLEKLTPDASSSIQDYNDDVDLDTFLKSPDMPPDIKIALYENMLKRFRHHTEREENRPIKVETVQPPESTSKQVIARGRYSEDDLQRLVNNYFAQTHRENAIHILRLINNHPEVLQWNDQKEIMWRGSSVVGSNIIDLLHDVLRRLQRFNNKPLQGRREFLSALTWLNVPESFIGNRDRLTTIRKLKMDAAQANIVSADSPVLGRPRASSVPTLRRRLPIVQEVNSPGVSLEAASAALPTLSDNEDNPFDQVAPRALPNWQAYDDNDEDI